MANIEVRAQNQPIHGVFLLNSNSINNLEIARAIHQAPHFLQTMMGCSRCEFFGGENSSFVQPRLAADSSQEVQIQCEAANFDGAPCKTKFEEQQRVEIPQAETETHTMRRAIIKLTDTCQMRCVYCVNDDGSEKTSNISPITVYDILSRFRPKEIEFTGGEPTIKHPLLLESVRIAQQFSDEIILNTNMELLTTEKMKQLELAGLSHLHFALHALDPELHKQVRGHQHASIDKVLQNIESALKNTKLNVIVEFVPMKINMHEFPKVYEYVRQLREKYGERIVELEVGRLIPKGRAQQEMAPTISELMPILESIGTPTYPVEVFCFGKTVSQTLTVMGFQIYPCDAGKGMFYFEINGGVVADNFSGIRVTDDFRKFDPKQFQGISCPFR